MNSVKVPEGVCRQCRSAPAVIGKTRCLECARIGCLMQKVLYYERKSKGLCVRCGKPSKAAVCPICRARSGNENRNNGESRNEEE